MARGDVSVVTGHDNALVKAGSETVTLQVPSGGAPPVTLRQGTDLRKHMIWGGVVLGLAVAVAVGVFDIVFPMSGKPSLSPLLPTDLPMDSPPTPAPPNAPTPAPVHPPMPNPGLTPTLKAGLEPSPLSTPPPTDPPRTSPSPLTLPPTDPPVEEPAPPVAGWILAEAGESCSAACTAAGGACNAAGNDRVNDNATLKYVVETVFGLYCAVTGYSSPNPAAPHVSSDRSCNYQPANHDCSSAIRNSHIHNMCCCADDFANCPVSAAEAAPGWVLATENESCNAACTAAGGECNAAGNDRVNDFATLMYVAGTVLGQTCETTFSSEWSAAPYFNTSTGWCGYQSGNHDCSVSTGSGNRNVCCCADFADCPVSVNPEAWGWVLAEENESCNATCATVGGACNAAGNDRVNNAATFRYVAEAVLGLTCKYLGGSSSPEAPFFGISISDCRYRTNNNRDCSTAADGHRSMCCCADDFANCPVNNA